MKYMINFTDLTPDSCYKKRDKKVMAMNPLGEDAKQSDSLYTLIIHCRNSYNFLALQQEKTNFTESRLVYGRSEDDFGGLL